MSKIPYTTAYLNGKAFNCPHCDAYAKQDWSEHWDNEQRNVDGLSTSKCSQCGEYAIWNYSTLLYPESSTVEQPNEDLSVDISKDYREAMSIVQKSPRAAAALLRLAIQKLCIELGQSGDNLNQDIKNLVKEGLSPRVQKMLDTVRVIGNHSVHPAEINLNDNPQTAQALFRLVNKIAKRDDNKIEKNDK